MASWFFIVTWLHAGGAVAAVDVPPAATMSFERAVPIEADGAAIELGGRAATRCADWDRDGDVDLLVGGGDGRLWLFRNDGTPQAARFARGETIVAGKRERWGDASTGVVLADMVGDARPELVVGHSGDRIALHENVGTAERPQFAETAVEFTVQAACGGRFDVGDWDGDGLLDLVTGSFGGAVVWYRNTGRAGEPKFGDGEPLGDLRVAYNAHPRIVDFNRDGRLDLLLGVNWGSVSWYEYDGTAAAERNWREPRPLRWADGANLNLRELNGDDTTPDFADLDGDGVLDLVSGGKNGRLFLMRGVGYRTQLETFRSTLAARAGELGPALGDDATLRDRIFGALAAIQADLADGLIAPEARAQLFDELAPLARQYPTILGRNRFDLETSPHLPLLAAQYWVVVFESRPDSPAHREQVADALAFAGGYRALLVDLGVLFIDNDTATPEHLAAMHRLMIAVPRAAWDVETITVAGWLGPAFKTQKIHKRTGVNIFDLPLGKPENGFAADAPRPGVTDVYLICLAHELAHNMLDTVGRRTRPDLFERKFAGLAQAAGSDVVYQSPKSRGIDLAATKERFRAAGAWNGDAAAWTQAWAAYFDNRERFDRAYVRGNVRFFLDAPQEAFATLANQYFADSGLMLEFCKSRWDAGHRSNVNQFLLIAEYLSAGADRVPFYVLRTGGDLTTETAALERDPQGRIDHVTWRGGAAEFDYGADDLVTEFRLLPAAAAR